MLRPRRSRFEGVDLAPELVDEHFRRRHICDELRQLRRERILHVLGLLDLPSGELGAIGLGDGVWNLRSAVWVDRREADLDEPAFAGGKHLQVAKICLEHSVLLTLAGLRAAKANAPHDRRYHVDIAARRIELGLLGKAEFLYDLGRQRWRTQRTDVRVDRLFVHPGRGVVGRRSCLFRVSERARRHLGFDGQLGLGLEPWRHHRQYPVGRNADGESGDRNARDCAHHASNQGHAVDVVGRGRRRDRCLAHC